MNLSHLLLHAKTINDVSIIISDMKSSLVTRMKNLYNII